MNPNQQRIPVILGILLSLCFLNPFNARLLAHDGHSGCSHAKNKITDKFFGIESTGFSGTGANIDVTYHRCNWRINPDSSVKAIGGSVTTYFKTILNNVTSIDFDLNTVLTVTSVRF